MSTVNRRVTRARRRRIKKLRRAFTERFYEPPRRLPHETLAMYEAGLRELLLDTLRRQAE